MGSGIASRSALSGSPTILLDTKLEYAEKGRKSAWDCIDELVENQLATPEQGEKAKALIAVSACMHESCQKAKGVIEAVTEKLELKQQIFKSLDELLPAEIPIMSNTSGLRITDIAALTAHPERTMTTHFWFPAHLVPLVEVVMSEKTDRKMAEDVKAMLDGWGKSAVLVKRDLPGQLANRILQAVIREAVDTAVKMGMGIRFPVWGPLEHIEAVGLDLGLNVQRTVLPEISSDTEPSRYLSNLVGNGNLGYKTGSGFYNWKEKDMEALAKRRNDFIISALQFMKKHP